MMPIQYLSPIWSVRNHLQCNLKNTSSVLKACLTRSSYFSEHLWYWLEYLLDTRVFAVFGRWTLVHVGPATVVFNYFHFPSKKVGLTWTFLLDVQMDLWIPLFHNLVWHQQSKSLRQTNNETWIFASGRGLDLASQFQLLEYQMWTYMYNIHVYT